MAAKKPPDEIQHQCFYLDLESPEPQVVPAVQLQQRQIKMTYLSAVEQQAVPSSITSTSSDKSGICKQIVGTELLLGEESFSGTSQELYTNGQTVHEQAMSARESSSSLLSVEYKAQSSQVHDVAHAQVLEFFEEQDKTFKEHGGTIHQKKTRSPSPSPVRQSVGLDHLDNLVKLMEQLSSLRDENVKLKKKCEYLESTKSLLEVKSALEQEILSHSEYSSMPSSTKSAPIRGRVSRPRLPSAEDVTGFNIEEVPLESNGNQSKPSVYKRSYSTGSLDISSEILEHPDDADISSKLLSKSYDKGTRGRHKDPKSPSSKQKSKWARFKKVISRPKLPEEISFSLKYIKDFGRGSVSSSKELTVPTSTMENRSVDSGVGSGLEADGQEVNRKSTSSGEPPSPSPYTKQQQELMEEALAPEEDLGTEIWMGDPEWLEKHGEEMLSDSITKEVIVLNSAQKCETDNYLTIPLPRRKSSPSLLDHNEDTMDVEEAREYLNLRRSSSYKGRSSHGDISDTNMLSTNSPKLQKKSLKHTWGKSFLQNIVHTGKGSIKRIKRAGKSDFEPGHEVHLLEVDGDTYEDMRNIYSEQEGPLGRSTPKTSPICIPRHKGPDEYTPSSRTRFLPKQSSLVDVEAILGSMSDEFSKKMEQWEEKRNKAQSPPKDEDSELMFPENLGTVSPEFQKKMDEWERTKSIKTFGTSNRQQDEKEPVDSREGSPLETLTTNDLQPTVHVEELQRKLTQSFNRKLEEWERIKYRKESAVPSSPTFDRKDITSKSLYSRKEGTHSSRKIKGEKDKGKLERRRERELQRVEREQQKLEKERIRIEKERLKALEREARIQRMRGRLSQPDMETKRPILSPLTDYKVTTDFARKLYEWETKKGISSLSMTSYLEAQQRQMEQLQLADGAKKDDAGDEAFAAEGSTKLEKGERPPPLTLQPCFDSPEEISPGDKSSETSFDEETSYTMDSMMECNITSLEKANTQLMEKLHEKEIEYETLQEEVRELSDRLNRVKDQHSKEIGWQGGQQSLTHPTQNVVAEFLDLEDKIGELQHFGENLAASMESAAVCKWQSLEGQESVNSRLVELLEQMKIMLMQASKSQEASQTSSALNSFDKLYRQAMQLQVQLSNLRLSQLERNKEIVSMKRQLLLQEANNLLLQTDITRRESELSRYKAMGKHSGASIKRWNTYGGMESRVVESEEIEHIPRYKRFAKSRKKTDRPSIESRPFALETAEPSTSPDTSKEDTILHADETSGHFMDVKQHSHSSASFTSTDENHLPNHVVDSLEYIDENVAEIDHTEHQIECMETEDSIKLSKEENQVKCINLESEKSVEISMIKLPTANILLPRDLSQQELSVPRSVRTDTTQSVEMIKQEESVQYEVSYKSDTKFPELLIPERHKSSLKGQLIKLPSFDSEHDDRPTEILDNLRINSTDSEVKLLSDGTSRSDSESRSVSKSMEDTEGSSFEHDTVFIESQPHKPVNVVHSAPASQSGTLEGIKKKMERKSGKESMSSVSPILPKRSTHPPAHWPRIRPVSSAHRIKPAEELLEESRRYRKGHSIYMMRILRKYALSDDTGKYMDSQNIKDGNKENIKEGYVKAIVKRLSRESTPEYNKRISDISSTTLGSLTIHRSDSPRTKSEFVQQIVRKLSSPSGPELLRSSGTPLSDLTNGGGKKVKQLAEAFDGGSTRTTPDRALSDSECRPFKSVLLTSKHVTHELRDSLYDSSSTLTNSQSLSTTAELSDSGKPDSVISAAALNFSSMPLLTVKEEGQGDVENGYRERASTTATCDKNGSGQPEKQEIYVAVSSPDVLGESSASQAEKFNISKHTLNPKQKGSKKIEIHFPVRSSERPSGKVKMGTIGVLCQQSMLSFDLGLSLQAAEQKVTGSKKQKQEDCGQSHARPLSSGSEGEPSTSADDRRRSRTRFFESKWLQKKFFKVSK